MDYKYIEQLLERYWECQTTLEEEAILRTFFAQDDIPASLLPYRDLFLAEEEMAQEHLDEDFLAQRFRPLYRAAAVVAVVLTIGMAAQQGFERTHTEELPYAVQMAATGTESDTLQLFTDMPEPLQQTEATLVAPQADTLVSLQP